MRVTSRNRLPSYDYLYFLLWLPALCWAGYGVGYCSWVMFFLIIFRDRFKEMSSLKGSHVIFLFTLFEINIDKRLRKWFPFPPPFLFPTNIYHSHFNSRVKLHLPLFFKRTFTASSELICIIEESKERLIITVRA